MEINVQTLGRSKKRTKVFMEREQGKGEALAKFDSQMKESERQKKSQYQSQSSQPAEKSTVD